MPIPEHTVRAMLATVRQAAFADDLPATVVGCLHEVVGADYVTYDDFGPARTATVADPLPPDWVGEAWARFGNQHPSLPVCLNSAAPRTVRLSDVASQREIRRLELWDHVWGPLGIRRQLNVPLYQAGARLVGLGLNRNGHDFNDSELAVVELLRVELSQIVAARERRATEPVGSAGLTAREREVLGWLATGLRDREIARELGVSTRTVSKHLQAVYRKLGVTTRAGAVAKMTARALPPAST